MSQTNTPIVAPVSLSTAPGPVADTLKAIKTKIGMIPNLYATLAHSPAALNATLAASEAIAGSSLAASEREIVALATSQANSCHYCLSAHTLIGKGAGLSLEQTLQARAGTGSTPRHAAIARLAKDLVANKGHVSGQDVAAARAAGLSDAELMEVVVNTALTVLTNFANNLAHTELDFPAVPVALPA
ncbi:putative peroxidase-related enzyme [Paraburkholderia bannensis]|uniref:Putative peroxidase-related enzyme n=1 Tax=Paraburkholderia bannensis TaxID=765414 RepID=A0A7W9U534_9BURK|nr:MULTISPECIES: peroxidase-related enzyme [Paraburkholderia]MBB3262201.1 putative peroxidase-related enzyme [Paraburkholderia sp. WP4_3_2]MBB6107168.1 putative peroxidase-related enzyme [Paraburkholderia bannensis]